MATHTQLTALPAELLVKLYQALPSFNDALNLKATCHALHGIWTHHRSIIINNIASTNFECYSSARQLLSKQRIDVPLDSTELSDDDLFALTQNAKRIEGAIAKIEQEIIPNLKVTMIPKSKRDTIYNGTGIHPPKLTATERARIVKTLYQIWIFLYISDPELQNLIFNIQPRQLFYLIELVNWSRMASFPETDRYYLYPIGSDARLALLYLYSVTYDCAPPALERTARIGEEARLVVVWDFYQNTLRNLICRKPMGRLQWDEEAEPKKHLWNYEEGDEGYLAEDW